MYDLNFFRNNLEQIRERLATRGFVLDTEFFAELDRKRRQLVTESERLKADRNQATVEIGRLRKSGADTSERQAQVRETGTRIATLDAEVNTLDGQFRDFLARVPNLPQESVPVGKDESANVEIRRHGTPGNFEFAPKAHWDIGADLGILDLDRGAKIAGARFAVYWGLGAKLERALANFMLDLHTREHGYQEVLPPALVNSTSLYGTGQLPKFEADLFKCQGHDLWLVPTAEVPVTNLFRDETLDADNLPISLCAYTPCFRSEAGSYGRDVRGVIRQHQFQKVELVKFARPDQSGEQHEKLTRDAETVLEKLGLPYRTVLLCTGDTGFGAAKTYDLEVWLPGQNAFKEISSCSNYEAFQARRATIRAKSGKAKVDFVHTLNGSGLAIGRTWVAIVENYQQADGSVSIPQVLQPYLNAERIDRTGGRLL
ncbi:MAG TPA: serine--tRNA ligase [Bryobacteraceae bacterium]|jgi:seryl-tRNA synthetase|nr:serine--tRNA ligase [Bryobacteraceae bacterium]